MTCMEDLTSKSGEVVIFKGTVVIVEDASVDFLAVKNLLTYDSLAGVPYKYLRMCTPKEEKSYLELLQAAKEELKEGSIESIKFSHVPQSEDRVRLKDFSKVLIDKIKSKNYGNSLELEALVNTEVEDFIIK